MSAAASTSAASSGAVVEALVGIRARVAAAAAAAAASTSSKLPTYSTPPTHTPCAGIVASTTTGTSASAAADVHLIAVSKMQPSTAIRACALQAGQRDFGENYVQELVSKDAELQDAPVIKWHFIGHLQSNKVKTVLAVQRLFAVHTVDRVSLARKMDAEWGRLVSLEQDSTLNRRLPGEVQADSANSDQTEESSTPSQIRQARLKVLLQVNTSGEASKSGVSPDGSALVDLARVVHEELDHLELHGLMTIGRPDAGPEQPDFALLSACRERICNGLNLPNTALKLSMGMSHDFEDAIAFGANYVRVGSSIFGARPYPAQT